MRVHLLLASSIALYSGSGIQAADNTQEQALAAVKKLGGKVQFDGKDKSKPVIAVDLDSKPLTDYELDILQAFSQLRLLSLNQTPVTDAGLKHIQGLTSLRTLNLIRTKNPKHGLISDAGLKRLNGLTNLQTLNLGGTQVTDAGLVHLEGLKK